MKKELSLLLRVGISLGLIWFVFRKIDLADLWSRIAAARPLYLIFAILLMVFVTAISGLRLKIVLKVQNISMTFFRMTALSFIGAFFNNFMPTSIGGDVIKTYFIARESGKNLPAIISVLVDRTMGYMALVIYLPIALLLGFDYMTEPKIRALVAIVTLVSVCILSLLFSRTLFKPFYHLIKKIKVMNLGNMLAEIYEGLQVYKKHPLSFAGVVALAIFMQSLTIVSVYLLGLALNLEVGLIYYFICVPLTFVAIMTPSINGVGVREATFVYLFCTILKVIPRQEDAVALSLMTFALYLINSLFGGLFYAFSGTVKKTDLKGELPRENISFKDLE